jgi:hypothetical protein
MNGCCIGAGLNMAVALAVLGICLFGDCALPRRTEAHGPLLPEVIGILRDRGTQWMVFGCAGVYLVAFALLRKRLARGGNPGTGECREWSVGERTSIVRTRWGLAAQWLGSLMALATLAYSLNYAEAVKSTQALTLVGAAMIGQGTAFWAELPRSNARRPKWGREAVVGTLIFLVTLAAVWQGETGHLFQYRGQARWSGPWENPNTFGMLMGVGFVLGVGSLKSKVQSLKSGAWKHPTSKWMLWLTAVLLLGAAGAVGVGLVKSYSRGAWIGTAVGLAYLFWNAEGSRRNEEARVPPRGWLTWAFIFASVSMLAFWGFRYTDRAVARRAYSVASANDFSWRNRVAAYEGALQMMAQRPWFGFGWSQPEMVYDRYYRLAKVDEGMAVQLNDYFMLGMTLGVPALVCFLAYVGLSLKSNVQCLKSKVGGLESTAASPEPEVAQRLAFSAQTLSWSRVCCAGVIVLLVGFWFDGGLFKLATGATFWTLLELGRIGAGKIHELDENG